MFMFQEVKNEIANRILELRQTKGGMNRLLEENKRLVGYLLKNRYSSCVEQKDDLFSVGMIGLWSAIKKFAPELGSFSSYAVWKIRSAIYREIRMRNTKKKREISLDAFEDKDKFSIRENTGLEHIFVSDAVASIMSKLKAKDREVLAMRYLQGASLETIGKRLDVTRERARQIIDKARNEAVKLSRL